MYLQKNLFPQLQYHIPGYDIFLKLKLIQILLIPWQR